MASLISTAILASEEGAAVSEGGFPAWGFGAVALGALVVLLVITVMLNVDR